MDEGRITKPTAGTFQYEYFLTDHLGNTRTVFADGNGDGVLADNEVLQETHYYPFGMSIGDLAIDRGVDNKIRFGGKELQDDDLNGVNLALIDFGARFLDNFRWTTIDPRAEERYSLSPYNYCSLNPINRIDPDGMLDDEWDYDVETSEMEWKSDKGGSETQYVNIKQDGKQIGEASVSGDKVFAYKLRNSVVVTNKDRLFNDQTYNSETGYEYTSEEFKVRNKYIESGSVFKTAILSAESQGKPLSITYKEEEKKYGYTTMRIRMLGLAISTTWDILPSPSPNVRRIGKLNLATTSSVKPGLYGYKGLSSLTGKTSWNRFLQANKGKYSGKGWQQKAAADYYNSNFYKQ